MSTTVDQQKYLKKYLSTTKSLKQRKKLKKKTAVRLNIIDDDIDLATFNEAVTEDLTGPEIEDAPQIVGVTDERPLELRVSDYKTDMWKSVTVLDSDEEDDETKLKRKRERDNFSPSMVKIEPGDSDNSPPRREYYNKTAPKQRQKGHNPSSSVDDNSPPRKGTKRKDEDNSPIRTEQSRTKRSSPDGSNEDNSPLRDKSRRSQRNNSPLRSPKNSNERMLREEDRGIKRRKSRWSNEEGGDSNPPRKVAPRSGDDNSPPRRKNKDYQEKNSSPRRNIPRGRIDKDNSPPRRDKARESSPYRKNRDKTPPRKSKHENNASSRRKGEPYKNAERRTEKKRDSQGDDRSSKSEQDCDRNRNNPSTSKTREDKQHEKHGNDKNDSSISSKLYISEPSSFGKEKSTTSQKSMEVDLNLINKEVTESEIPVPKTIVRDRKTGRIRNLQEEAAASKEKAKEKEALQEKYSRWGKGLKQVDDANEKRALDLYEMQKPLARYADDTDLENMLRNREREGDPMLAYMRKKKREKAAKDPNAKPEKPTYLGDSGPPNRFGIRPGHRWDGVNRSNGFENKYFEVQNARRAHQTESYKWSSEDM